ncbi:homocysteine S-methyltransferase family protein [Methylobacterium durans]|uniref:Homocysteine methyltransferase n=1 Tax=Methylobacterium durans TaxID=2202825 RepID=A0A2U8WBL4_9HYPH|nr:homocysteine S-methyltransferase family protein [Methylobacterium durans]AWN43473.1 homocysteine methyltransferase [Methylobacterium durans]
MPQFRESLPQLTGRPFLTEGGIGTTLLFHENVDLPHFAHFPLLLNEEGRATLARFFEPYLELAKRYRVGMILDTPTWRANPDWGAKLGYDAVALAKVNRMAVSFLDALRRRHAQLDLPLVLNGVIGPRGDGYAVETAMTAEEAAAYHHPQIEVFRDSGADMVSALTLTFVEEAIGIAIAARDSKMPVAISFTLGTDGRLPSGQPLGTAIEETDAVTGAYPAYFMINCAHPLHFEAVLAEGAGWLSRIRGIRANASTKSHAELDVASDLDSGDPHDLGRRYATLRGQLPNLTVLGGCCGTDHRHIAAICEACL